MASKAPNPQTTGSNPNQTQSRQAPVGRTPPHRDGRGQQLSILVSWPQKELLNINEVVEEFLTKLEKHGIAVEDKTLHTDKMLIREGDPTKAKECLDSVICWDMFFFRSADESEFASKLTELRSKFKDKFAAKVSQGGRVEVAFLPSIKQEVLPVLDDLKFGKKLVPLPNFLLEFFKRHLQSFSARFNSNFHSRVELSIVDGGPQRQPHLQLTCERSMLPEVVKVFEKRVSLLCCRQVGVKRSLAWYLQTSEEGKKKVKDIEEARCAVGVSVEEERLLLEAKSPKGHVVKLSEGSLAGTTCPVLVLPLCEGQAEWHSAYECILLRGCLNSSASHYLSRMGPAPKAVTLVLKCQELAIGQTVIIMYVPAQSTDPSHNTVSKALTEALNYAKRMGSELALPVTCGDVNIQHLMTAVCNCSDDDNFPPLVHFYSDPGMTYLKDASDFLQTKKWTVQISRVTETVDTRFDQRVKVVIGDILNTEADAVVNSTDPKLEHLHGQVSKMFLEHLGDDLTRQCRELYPKATGDAGEHIVAITEAFSLTQFKYIFHICMPQIHWRWHRAEELLQALRTSVEACLCLASLKGLKSIVFPALATGVLQYPEDLEAGTVLETAKEFFAQMPHSSLSQVTFVAYQSNTSVVKTFKAEETYWRYALHRVAVDACGKVDRRFEVRNVLVQVIKGDATTRQCSAELLICADPPAKGTLQDYQKQMTEDCKVSVVNSSHVRNGIRDALKNTTAGSVQLNMQTFDAGQVDNIVSGIERANSKKVKIIVIVVSSTDAFRRLCSKLSGSYSSPASKRDTVPRQKYLAHVSICGSTKDTSEAVKKVSELKVPEKYKEADRFDLHPSFLEPSDGNSSPGPSAGPPPAPHSPAPASPPASTPTGESFQQPQEQQPVSIKIPRKELKGVDMERLLNEFEKRMISVNFSGGVTEFRTKHRNWEQLRLCVQNTIGEMLHGGAQTAPAGNFVAEAVDPAAPVPSPVQSLTTGDSEDPSSSLVINSAGSLNIPSTFMSQQLASGRDLDKNISHMGKDDNAKHAAAAAAQPAENRDGVVSVDSQGDGAKTREHVPQAVAESVSYSSQDSGPVAAAADSKEALSSEDEGTIMAAAKDEALAFLHQHYQRTDPGGAGSVEDQLLRHEEIALSPQELAKLGPSIDCSAEDVAAYVKVLPMLRKAVVFAFDYIPMNRAKNIVKVKCGRLATTIRRRGKAEQRLASSFRSPQTARTGQMETAFLTQINPGQAVGTAATHSTEVKDRQFVTRKGVKVLVSAGDITKIAADAIVSPAHEKLAPRVTDVAVTTGGALACQKVLQARGPRWEDYADKDLCRQHLADTIFNCLKTADSLGFRSVAVSPVGSGLSGGVPQEVCARSYLDAVLTFDVGHGDGARLRTIHFMDLDDDMIRVIQEVFADGLHHTD